MEASFGQMGLKLRLGCLFRATEAEVYWTVEGWKAAWRGRPLAVRGTRKELSTRCSRRMANSALASGKRQGKAAFA